MAVHLRVVDEDFVERRRKENFEATNLRQDIQKPRIPLPGSFITSENSVQYEHTSKRYGHSINQEDNTFREGGYMENDKLLEQYISKLDRDQSDLRADIRASEERIIKNNSDLEQRLYNHSTEMEKRLFEHSQKSEQRCMEKSTEVEKRIDNRIERLSSLIEKQNELMTQKFDKLEDKIDTKIEKLNDKVESSAKENQKFMWGITFTIIGLALAMGIGLVQIVLSVQSMSKPTTYTSPPQISSTINPNTQTPQE